MVEFIKVIEFNRIINITVLRRVTYQILLLSTYQILLLSTC